jgi:hypothetical protein
VSISTTLRAQIAAMVRELAANGQKPTTIEVSPYSTIALEGCRRICGLRVVVRETYLDGEIHLCGGKAQR